MKKTVIGVLRHLLIPVGFIWATGIFSQLSKIEFDGTAKYTAHQFDSTELATLEITPSNALAYGDSLIHERRRHIEKTGSYEPDLYFRDLKQYEMFDKKYFDFLRGTTEGKHLLLVCISGMGMSSRGQLVNLRDQNWRNTDITRDDIDAARSRWFPSDVARELASTQGPQVKFWSGIVNPFLSWMLRFYLKGLPLAFVLFLIWRMKLKKDVEEEYWGSARKPKFDFGFAPLSFLLSVLTWPVILYLDIRNRWSETLRRAEMLSRRTAMFSLLSIAEKRLVETGKRMSLKEFRAHLDVLGLRRKHSFASALLLTICFMMLPRIVMPAPLPSDFEHNQTVITNTDYGGAGQEVVQLDTTVSMEAVFPPCIDMPERPAPEILHYFEYASEILRGFCRDLGGVPKVLLQSRSSKLMYNLKHLNNEKYHNCAHILVPCSDVRPGVA